MHQVKHNPLRAILLVCAVALILHPNLLCAQFHLARLQYLSHNGAQLGQTIDLSVHGERLDQVRELRFSDPSIEATVKSLGPLPFDDQPRTQFGNFTVKIPADISPGRYEVRAIGRHGITNPRAFLISDRATQKYDKVSHDQNAATTLPKNQLVQSTCVAKQIDWFSFDIAEGESYTVELYAQSLDSSLIAQLELYDSNGRVVRRVRGDDDIDPVMKTDGIAAGSYRLAVRDFMYRGGPEFHYLLGCRDSGSPAVRLAASAQTAGQLPRHWMTRAVTLTQTIELNSMAEPTTGEVTTIQPPAEATHWFAPGAVDHRYQFDAKKGQQLAIDIVSQRLSEPTDPRMVIERMEPQADAEAKVHHVAHYDDSPNLTDGIVSMRSKDPVALFTAPEAATYRLLVRDLDIGTSLRRQQKYLLRIRSPDPGFDLVAYRVFAAKDANAVQPFSSKLFRGGVEMIRVFALRRDGWSGAIEVTVDGLPHGVSCHAAHIAANQDRTDLTLIANEQASGHCDALQIVGQSTDGSISQAAVPVTIAIARGHGRGSIQNRITDALPVHVSEQDVSPLTLNLGDGKTAEVKVGGSLSIPIRIVRREGGKTPCVFRPVHFPPGIAAGEVTIAADASEGKIELKPNANTKPGTYSIWLQTETKIKVRPDPQTLERHQAYRAKLQSLHDDPAQAENLASIKAAIVEADQRIEAAKAQANEQELTVFIPTNHTTIRVVQP